MYTVEKTSRAGSALMDIESYLLQEERSIYLTSEVNAASASMVIMALQFLERQSSQDIKLFIDSPGGTVPDGLAIVDAMERNRCDVVTICTGLAASMGAFIMAHGKKGKRYMTPHAEMMIHQPVASTGGQASDIMLSAKHIEKTKDTLNEMLALATGKPVEVIACDTDRDYYLDALAAIEYGLADQILAK